jgi:hypothetical protein
VEEIWLVNEVESASHTFHYEKHSSCRDQFDSDICFTQDGALHPSHFPCPKSLASISGLDLDILCVCRQIYYEARHIPYTENTFMTAHLSSFSNFLYCLKTWQIQCISHLSFKFPETLSMAEFLWEWNDIFSLIAASFFRLRTVSFQMQLYNKSNACYSTFWDAGLLKLDHLALSARYVAGDTHQFLNSVHASENNQDSSGTESVGSSQQSRPLHTTFFHDCRDQLPEIRYTIPVIMPIVLFSVHPHAISAHYMFGT